MKFTDKLGYLRYLVDKRGMQPVYMILGLTYDCNSFCRTCFNWEQLRKNKEHELSLEELQKTFASMGDLLFVVMSGGEPFLRLRERFPSIPLLLSARPCRESPSTPIIPSSRAAFRERFPIRSRRNRSRDAERTRTESAATSRAAIASRARRE